MAMIQPRNLTRDYRRRSQPMSEINVTPFVDVMLVLLIVFMVTAPLMTVGVEVNLPKANASIIDGSDEPLAISINAQGELYIQDQLVELSSLVARLNAITGENQDLRLFIRGDQDIEYGRVMEVMGKVSAAGYRNVALITQQPRKTSKPAASRKKKSADKSDTRKN